MAPVLVTGPEDMNVTSFEEIRLSCEGNGFPIPDITWYHNGTTLDADMEENINIKTTPTSSTQTVMSTLTISMAMVNDSGDYHCVLSSSVGEVMSEIALVLVQSKLVRWLYIAYNNPERWKITTAIVSGFRATCRCDKELRIHWLCGVT